LHPLLTDVPLGFFMSASVLDVVGGSRSRHAARRLAALGVLTAVPTAAAGLAEFPALADARTRRVGAAHAVGNGAVIFCYLQSWLARRRGRHGRGVAWGLAGGSLAWASGYLGGHLSFARGVGHGFRGMRDPAQRDVAPAPGLAAPATAFEENLR
jgi:uncharacterized membrane protein